MLDLACRLKTEALLMEVTVIQSVQNQQFNTCVCVCAREKTVNVRRQDRTITDAARVLYVRGCIFVNAKP